MYMRTVSAILMAVALAIAGCESASPRGGGATKEAGFKILVPATTTDIKQGETLNVSISLDRGIYFKQDVKLTAKATKGITVEPLSERVKASSMPEVQFLVTADKDAALGEYPVTIKATPEKGEPTSTEFDMRVIAP
jgi:hypothetical protein